MKENKQMKNREISICIGNGAEIIDFCPSCGKKNRGHLNDDIGEYWTCWGCGWSGETNQDAIIFGKEFTSYEYCPFCKKEYVTGEWNSDNPEYWVCDECKKRVTMSK